MTEPADPSPRLRARSTHKENTRPCGAEGTENGAGSRPLTRID